MAVIFYISGASPLLILAIWFSIGIVSNGAVDPKMVPLFLTIGLPLSVGTFAIAYWGSRARTGWP